VVQAYAFRCLFFATQPRSPIPLKNIAHVSGFDERAFQKIILQRQLPDLGVQYLQVDGRLIGPRLAAEHVGRLGQQLVLSVGDLVGVHVVLLRQLGQRLVASNGGHRHLGLERR